MAKIPPKNIVCLVDLRNRCPAAQIANFNKLLSKQRDYKLRLTKLKEGVESIDWDYYKRNVRAESVPLVEEFEKKYKSLKIPYPEDKYSPQLDEIKSQVEKDVAEFKKKSNERIAAYEKEIKRLKNMMPYAQMTYEDYCNMRPEVAPDFINKPTFWPHLPEEQIGYVHETLTPKQE